MKKLIIRKAKKRYQFVDSSKRKIKLKGMNKKKLLKKIIGINRINEKIDCFITNKSNTRHKVPKIKTRNGKYSYDDFQKLAKKRGVEENNIEGRLLTSSDKFNELTKETSPTLALLEWWCGKNDHLTWATKAKYIIRGSWCPQCFQERNLKWTYEKCQELAKRRGLEEKNIEGQLLTSEEEFNQMTERPSHRKVHLWCGITGHNPWSAKIYNIDQGKWCPTCKKRVGWTYEACQDLAERRGVEENGNEGKLLTPREEFNKIKAAIGHSKLKWRCGIKEHRPWYAPSNNIDQGSWCPDCANNRKKTYREMQELGRRRGIEENGIAGLLLTNEEEFNELIKRTKPSQAYLKWWCRNESHNPWMAKPNWIQQGSWCPYCSEGKFAGICRWYFEQIFNAQFPTTMLYKIICTYNGRLHLDGYAVVCILGVVFKIAFEYDGRQHYDFPNHVHKTKQEFKRQKDNDRIKKKICEEYEIILIEFPYWVDRHMNNPKKIQNYIKKEFKKKTGIKLKDIPQYDHRK